MSFPQPPNQPGPPFGGYPEPSYPPAQPRQRGGSGLLIGLGIFAVVALLSAALLVAVSGGSDGGVVQIASNPVTGGGNTPGDPQVPPTGESDEGEIIGAEADEAGEVAAEATEWISAYWQTEMPEVFDIDYEPISGGLYSASSDETLPPCAESADQIAGNAFYCSDGDLIAWDDEVLMPDLLEYYGPLAVAVVLAHEWGHAIQARVQMRGSTVTLEHQADCYAGAWVSDVQGQSDRFSIEGGALDAALAGFLAIADTPGTSAQDPNAHGSAFDRINGFQDGFLNGATSCADYRDNNIALVELPFTSREDLARGGNAPYADILEWTMADLEDYWTQVAAANDLVWKPLNTPVTFSGTGDDVDCGGSKAEGYSLFYCAADHYVGYDDVGLFPAVYSEIGDYAISVLYSNQYGFPAQQMLGFETSSAKESSLLSDCLSGSWASSVFQENRPETGSLVLSPGDLDEAVGTLLEFGDEDSEGETGSGFERVDAFRTGVLDGISGCEAAFTS